MVEHGRKLATIARVGSDWARISRSVDRCIMGRTRVSRVLRR